MNNGEHRVNKSLENERRVEHLCNLVEKKTRTERHLEEHSGISSSQENIEHAVEIQRERKQEIEDLKDILSHGENAKNRQFENTQKRFLYAEGYLNHNADRMDGQSFQNAKERQENRKKQMDHMR